jgi:cytidylate kinase
MCVITLSREIGSEGNSIAAKVAQALGYHLADKSTVETVFREYGLTDLEGQYESIPSFWERFDSQKADQRRTTLNMLNQTLCALAHHDNVVILGRGGYVILRDYQDVLNVRVQAPLETRIHRVRDSVAYSDSIHAEETVKADDRLQKEFIKSVYGASWVEPGGFDLVIDTGKLTPDMAVDVIVTAAQALSARHPDGLTIADLKVDKTLAAAVDEALSPVGADTH